MQRGNLRVTLCKLFCSLAALINAQFREQTDVQAPATEIKSLGTSNENRQTPFPIANIKASLAFKLVDPVCHEPMDGTIKLKKDMITAEKLFI